MILDDSYFSGDEIVNTFASRTNYRLAMTITTFVLIHVIYPELDRSLSSLLGVFLGCIQCWGRFLNCPSALIFQYTVRSNSVRLQHCEAV